MLSRRDYPKNYPADDETIHVPHHCKECGESFMGPVNVTTCAECKDEKFIGIERTDPCGSPEKNEDGEYLTPLTHLQESPVASWTEQFNKIVEEAFLDGYEKGRLDNTPDVILTEGIEDILLVIHQMIQRRSKSKEEHKKCQHTLD